MGEKRRKLTITQVSDNPVSADSSALVDCNLIHSTRFQVNCVGVCYCGLIANLNRLWNFAKTSSERILVSTLPETSNIIRDLNTTV